MKPDIVMIGGRSAGARPSTSPASALSGAESFHFAILLSGYPQP